MIKKLLAVILIICTTFGLYTTFRYSKTVNTLSSVFGGSLEKSEDGRWFYRKPDGSRQEIRSDWKLSETSEGLQFCIQEGYETKETGFSIIFQNNEGAEVSLLENSLAVDQQIGGRWYQVPVLILGQMTWSF